MKLLLSGTDAVAGTARVGEYVRHRPEQTLLYQLVEAHYPRLWNTWRRVGARYRRMCNASLRPI